MRGYNLFSYLSCRVDRRYKIFNREMLGSLFGKEKENKDSNNSVEIDSEHEALEIHNTARYNALCKSFNDQYVVYKNAFGKEGDYYNIQNIMSLEELTQGMDELIDYITQVYQKARATNNTKDFKKRKRRRCSRR
jgi:hypothetical protein